MLSGEGGSFVGMFSTYTNITATLANDLDFSFFNANATLNASAAMGDATRWVGHTHTILHSWGDGHPRGYAHLSGYTHPRAL